MLSGNSEKQLFWHFFEIFGKRLSGNSEKYDNLIGFLARNQKSGDENSEDENLGDLNSGDENSG